MCRSAQLQRTLRAKLVSLSKQGPVLSLCSMPYLCVVVLRAHCFRHRGPCVRAVARGDVGTVAGRLSWPLTHAAYLYAERYAVSGGRARGQPRAL